MRTTTRMCQPFAGMLWMLGPFFLLLSCNIDHGLEPIQTRIKGIVEFSGPAPGEQVAEVRVAATKNFPPQNLTTDLLYSNQLEIRREQSGSYSVPFEIAAPPGAYPAIGVLWRESGKSWEITNILGIYTDPAALAPKKVVVDEDHPVVDSVIIGADWTLAQRTSFLEGDIYFKGEWPEDTEILALGVFPIIPNPGNPLEFLTLQALDIAIPLFRSEPFHYRTRVPAGTFRFIAVFWKGKSGGLFDIRAIGFHACANDSTIPRPVVVAENSTASGIDISVDLSSLPGGARYRFDTFGCE